MRVAIFSAFDTVLNPYILLFKETLERQGLEVYMEREFNLKWLLSKGKSCDCIHLHWIKHSYNPSRKNIRSYFFKRLIENRFVRALLDVICLINLSLALLLAKLTGKTIVFTVHDLFKFGKQSLRGRMQVWIARYVVFLLSDSVHVHNHHSRKLIRAIYKRKNGISVIPHGNYIGRYPNQVSKTEARLRLGLPGDAFVYLFLGLLRPYKGLEDLFEAFETVEWPGARLLVAGRVFGVDSYESRLLDLTRSNSKIMLVPEFIADEAIQLYMNACDVFVLPYKDITTSGAAALALSFGRPIIAPAITSFPEVITSEVGILYDTSQPNGLVSALRDAKTRSWSESKIFDYAHQFDWDKLGPQFAALYTKHDGRRQ